jgi:hypothetical protein
MDNDVGNIEHPGRLFEEGLAMVDIITRDWPRDMNGRVIEDQTPKEIVTPLPDPTPAEVSAQKDVRIDAVDSVVFKVLFDHEKRIRVLEGKTGPTIAAFRTALKALF